MVDTNPEVGDPVSADLLSFMINKPSIKLVQQAAQSIPNATTTALTFGAGSEEIESHPWHDTVTNNSRITPDIPGVYIVYVTYSAASSAAITNMFAVIGKNGSTVQPLVRVNPAATATSKGVQAVGSVTINGTGDYIEALVQQTSGGALNTQAGGGVNSVLEVHYDRPLP